jgi:hypothetical protein
MGEEIIGNGGLHHLQEVIKGGFGGVPDKGIIG